MFCAAAAGVVGWFFTTIGPQTSFRVFTVNVILANERLLRILDQNSRELLVATIGTLIPENAKPTRCSDGEMCLDWPEYARVVIRHHGNSDARCYQVLWTVPDCRTSQLQDCVKMDNAHWYSGTLVDKQYWPIEKWRRKPTPFISGDLKKGEYGSVLERYWLSSNGVAIYIDQTVPLFVSINQSHDGNLCLIAEFKNPPYQYPSNRTVHLNYTICQAHSAKAVHTYIAKRIHKMPAYIPEERMFQFPVWSTKAIFNKNVNQSAVLQYADKIQSHNLSIFKLEIDHGWSSSYGDVSFDTKKFPSPKYLFSALKNKGISVNLWVHPFSNLESKSFKSGMELGYWVRNCDGKLPALVSWWNGDGALLDVTNEDAVAWFVDKLHSMQRLGVNSFLFDGGAASWLPACYKTEVDLPGPDAYTQLYGQLAYSIDTMYRHQSVSSGAGTQNLPLLIHMPDKDSSWGYSNGLKTLIPQVLSLGLMGYPFILTPIIGGIRDDQNGELLSKELYIRWLQASVFLPTMHFSIPPWSYDTETVGITQKMVRLHQLYSPKILHLADLATVSGLPIVRPIWWVAKSYEKDAFLVDSQYLLGDDLLVAPVLEYGSRSLDVYLPHGFWKDELRGRVVLEGGQWYLDYRVELDELAFFTRVHNSTSFSKS